MSETSAAKLRTALDALAARPGRSRDREVASGTTSALSIDEVLLLHSIGWEPIDLVYGVSWWSIPWGVWQYQTGEIPEASSAFAGAMNEAVDHLRDECLRAGGSGAVGVSVELRVLSHHIDVSLSATAVRRIGHRSGQVEFLSELSARDFALLDRAGWTPIGLATGASFVVAPRRSARDWAAQQGQNTELTNLTEALYLARESAMERMQGAGSAMHADGVVNVKLREGPLGRGARVMQFVAIGTAVRVGTSGHRPVSPTLAVALDDPVRGFEVASLRTSS